MAWRWTDKSWTAAHLELAHAVFERVRRESAYAPMTSPLGPGNRLLRSFDRQYIGGGPPPPTIGMHTVLESIKVRDAVRDQNRFSGPLPGWSGHPAVQPRRGGLYLSEDIHAALAELYHYADPNLARQLIGHPKRLAVLEGRCFVSLRAVGELSVVNLESNAPGMLPFFRRIEQDPAVAAALRTSRHKDMFDAIYAPQDYAAARGLGLGLESNPEIDGIRVLSARDYEADAGGARVLRTGDNVMLFGLDQRLATDKVHVDALHLVDAVPGRPELQVTHYARGGGGAFRLENQATFTP
jgi:hypothetical protein